MVTLMLAFNALPWLDTVVVPLLVALVVGIPSLLAAQRMIEENRSQHGNNGDRLEKVHRDVNSLKGEITNLSEKMDRFVNRTESWRDHVDDHL
jgi:hypothetical protein